jgi:hypothetical protein
MTIRSARGDTYMKRCLYCLITKKLTQSILYNCKFTTKKVTKLFYRGGLRHLQIGRMLDIDLISEPPPRPLPLDVCFQGVGICMARGAGSDS